MNMHERRQNPRIKVTFPIPVVDQDRERLMGHLVDISLSGFMMLTPIPLEIGRVFQLCLELPQTSGGQVIRVGAESLWRENSGDAETYWAGFQIIDISTEDQQRIEHLIRDHL